MIGPDISNDRRYMQLTRDVLEMSTVLQPGTTSRDVISRALALDLDQDRQIFGGLAIPLLEGLQELQAVALGVDSNPDAAAISGRSLEGVLARVVAFGRELVAARVSELEGLAVRSGEGVSEGVEGQGTSEGHGSDDIGGSDKCVGGRVSVVTAGEVTVIGGDDWRVDTLVEI
jgi:hypothetical protein